MATPIWYRPFFPRTVRDAAQTLADHVDFWESDIMPIAWRTPALSDFLADAASVGDIAQAPRFRDLLAQYVDLSIDSARAQPGDDRHQRDRRRTVRDAIADAKRWLSGDPPDPPHAGIKRERDEEGVHV